MQSSIIASRDLEYAKLHVLDLLKQKMVKTFFVDEFKVEDAKEVLKEAYIAEEEPKYLLLCAQGYRHEAQNALLKLLEEPPRNIVFILIVKSKTSLLPTIRSRLKTTILKSSKEPYALGLKLERLGLRELFDFLKSHKNVPKEELKEIVQTLFKTASLEHGFTFTASELEMTHKLLELSDLNSRPQNILTYQLLTLFLAQGRRK